MQVQGIPCMYLHLKQFFKMTEDSCFTCQGCCALRRIIGCPKAPNHSIWGAQPLIFMQKIHFSSCLRTKVRSLSPPGTARVQPCLLAFPLIFACVSDVHMWNKCKASARQLNLLRIEALRSRNKCTTMFLTWKPACVPMFS